MRTAVLAASVALACASPAAAQMRLPCMPIDAALARLKDVGAVSVARMLDRDGDLWVMYAVPGGTAVVIMLSPANGAACGMEGNALEVTPMPAKGDPT